VSPRRGHRAWPVRRAHHPHRPLPCGLRPGERA